MDLIKREDAIKAFVDECEGPYEACMQVACGLFEDIPAQMEWIPTSEALPESTGVHYVDGCTLEESKLVLVYGESNYGPGYGMGRYIYDRAYPYDSGWSGCLDNAINLGDCTVKAWMPLPEPYIGG